MVGAMSIKPETFEKMLATSYCCQKHPASVREQTDWVHVMNGNRFRKLEICKCGRTREIQKIVVTSKGAAVYHIGMWSEEEKDTEDIWLDDAETVDESVFDLRPIIPVERRNGCWMMPTSSPKKAG